MMIKQSSLPQNLCFLTKDILERLALIVLSETQGVSFFLFSPHEEKNVELINYKLKLELLIVIIPDNLMIEYR